MRFKRIWIGFVLFFTWSVCSLPFQSQRFSVSGPSSYLKDVTRRIDRRGGNIVDMAVASALVLAVVSPFYVSLGAGGFALVDMGGKIDALDFREIAPQSMSADYYQNKSSILGGSSVGVPGFVAGLSALHKKYGKLPWSMLFKDAIFLAKQGYQIGGEWVRITKNVSELQYGMNFFFQKNKKPYQPGDTFKHKKLASALEKIQTKNKNGFYKGSVAVDVVKAVQNSGGEMTLQDLSNYRVRWLKPLQIEFKDYKIYSMPPPSSGGVVLFSALHLIDRKKMDQKKILGSEELHLLAEIMSRSFRGRSLIADPDFYDVPYERLLSSDHLQKMSQSISIRKVNKLKPIKETTHFVVMNKKGHTVTMTLTLNLPYGSKVVTPRYGIVLNNQMDDFTTKPNQANFFGLIQGKNNQVQFNKRPLSSMSPSLVKKDGKTVMALGGSGGPRIISGVLQVLYRTLINGLDIDQAIQFPRIHHQFLPRITYIEKNRFSSDVIHSLKKRNHQIEESTHLGKIYGISLSRDGILNAAFDFRGDGMAWGL